MLPVMTMNKFKHMLDFLKEESREPEPIHLVDVNYPDRSATTILAGGSGE